jgi:hypothetical protein
MPIAITPAGRFRFTTGFAGDRFIIRRYTHLLRTESDPDGRIAWFEVDDLSDRSSMHIDEDEAEQLETLWREGKVTGDFTALEAALAHLFDVVHPPEAPDAH